ncbi:hypothetical protein, partial [Clostridium polynesiense]|uniref:hypothetical protein n=1 Tax=Clostridium polynesiense TaxID=1325933 RepID=UPI00058BBDA6
LVIDLEELRDGVNHFKKNNPDYIQKIFNSLSKGNFIRALYERYEIFYEALTTTVKGNSFKNKKDTILERLTGIWLEESLYGVIEELKDEGIIDSYAVNFYRYRGDESNREAEIDFILLKDLKLYFLSVSSVDGIKKAKFKLYEVKQRARMVAENEAAIGTLTFIKDKEELIEDYKDIWEDDPINTLLLAWKDIPFIKEKITQWIQGKGEPINV